MIAPLNISHTASAGQRITASSVSVSSRGTRARDIPVPYRRAVRPTPAAPIFVPLALAQPGVQAVSEGAIAVQEWAQTAQADVASHRQSIAAYPSQTANVQILLPGMVSSAPLVQVDVRA